MPQFEIEIKSLLGDKIHADVLKDRLKGLDTHTRLTSQNKQLNHYFVGGDLCVLYEKVESYLRGDDRELLKKITDEGKDHSIRTRKRDEEVILVVKAAIDDTTSENGISRMEFEATVGITLEELDQILLDVGFTYQAKWSREREEYESGGMTVCIDKNAGYGYLAEFEKVVPDAERVEEIKRSLRERMEKLGVVELPQDRLSRMFAYYNEHWREYYGTDKIFVIE